MLKLRDVAKNFICYKVGDGSHIFFWFDCWHPAGYLLDTYGHRTVYDSGCSLEARLSTIIKDGEWYWPYTRSSNLVEIQSRIPEVDLGGSDQPIWKSSTGSYSCAATWEQLRVKKPIVEWWKLVWFSLSIPRHSFFLWLVFRDAIVTKERMCRWGYSGSTNCLFCHGFQESWDHLFSQCSYSRRIWRALMVECSYLNPPIDWESVSEWSIAVLHGKGLKSSLGKLCFWACVYHLWKQRNALIHGKIPKTEEAIILQIKWEVRSRILAKGSFKNLDKHVDLVYRWSLHKLL